MSSSPFLFLFTMDVIPEELMDGPLRTTLYADIALMAESKEELRDKSQDWTESGPRPNVKKNKFRSFKESTESIIDGHGEHGGVIEKVQLPIPEN
nr:unnamed protein product [Haemonchus contortus]